jgi:hypothetical protein
MKAKETTIKRDLSEVQREKEVRWEIRLKVQEDYYSIMEAEEEEQTVKRVMKLKESSRVKKREHWMMTKMTMRLEEVGHRNGKH